MPPSPQIETKAPIIEQQRREYETALAAHQEISDHLMQMQQSLQEERERNLDLAQQMEETELKLRLSEVRHVTHIAHDMQPISHTAHGMSAYSKRGLDLHPIDCPALIVEGANIDGFVFGICHEQKEVNDLSLQVNSLLKEQLRRDRASDASFGSPVPANRTSTAARAIIEVTDVDDMQQKNQELLRITRQLQDKMAEMQQHAGDSGTTAVGLKKALQELQALKEARKGQEEMVAVLIRQRDMYKALAAEGDVTQTMQSADGSVARSPMTPRGGGLDSVSSPQGRVADANKLKELQEEVAKLRQAQTELRDACSERESELVRLNATLRAAQSELAFEKSRAEDRAIAEARLRQEVQEQRESMSTLHTKLSEQEKAVLVAHDQVQAAKQQEIRLNHTLDLTRREKASLESRVTDLQQQLTNLQTERASSQQIMSGLQQLEQRFQARQSLEQQTLRDTLTAYVLHRVFQRGAQCIGAPALSVSVKAGLDPVLRTSGGGASRADL